MTEDPLRQPEFAATVAASIPLDLRSDETLAQLLDRGEMAVWRALFALARDDASLRHRIARIVLSIPTPLPYFWLAALVSLGEPIDLSTRVPAYDAGSI